MPLSRPLGELFGRGKSHAKKQSSTTFSSSHHNYYFHPTKRAQILCYAPLSITSTPLFLSHQFGLLKFLNELVK
ncbi:hypothetical protein L6452_43893 [Arctium lappa]|uniref:Uncharacterized protein n=1 Tax=Arctium lappa TaxID=4217 RepID=A0ACB8XEJ2_ARCLA|nr:hypothetical protein L6452_43893 [Arctium lappa]